MESVEDDDIALEPDQPPKSSTTGSTPTQRPSKKRTKTGCITCRKRRIKCGEERPTCKNCIKSKRDCGGYIQPLTFKQPNGDIRIPGNDPGGVYHGTIGSGIPPNHYQPTYHPSHIQPLPNYNTAHVHHSYPDPRFDTSYNDHGSDAAYGYPNLLRTSLQGAESPMWTWSAPNNTSFNQEPQVRKNWPQQPTESSRLHDFHTTNTGVSNEQSHPFSQPAFSRPHHSMSSASLSLATETLAEQYDNRNWSANHTRTPSTLQSSQLPSSTVSASSEKHHFETWDFPQTDDPNSFRRPHLNRGATMPINVEYGPPKNEVGIDYEQGRRYSVHGFVQRPSFDTQLPTSKAELSSASIVQGQSAEEEEEDDEDDPYDADMQFDEQASASTEQTEQELSMMLVRYAAQDDRQTRTFTTYLDSPNVLATYKPSHSASPLYDDRVGRIFCHFVSVTGPCLSVYERQAANSPITFSGLAVPSSQKMLWTYTLPSLAIHHPALLHALLALSSLHIAKIQKTSEDSSLKHFTYAVRRVGSLLGLPKRRHEIATLATILLLGFYEVMSADHSRWNLHLAGAKDLVMEFDFAGMARTTKRMRSQAKANFAQRFASSYEEHVQIAGIPETLLNDVDWEIDEGLVSQLTGFHIEYENQWQPNFRRQQQHQELTAKDVEDYKTKSDLRWWYCKQDIFQSMVSGDPLLMPYDQWIYCPPRAQIGKTNAAYASMDHLCLIMARLTDFGGKDRARKQRVVAAQGGQWRPPPDFSGPGRQLLETQLPLNHSTQNHQSTQTPHVRAPNGFATHPGPIHMASGQARSGSSSMPPPSNPSFYGMMPLPTEPIEMPSAFETMNANLRDPAFNKPMPVPEPTPDQGLDFETAAALTEHAAIVKAFDLFAESLGPEFERLPADTNPPISTPFGPAIQYRTYPIACVWAFYYVGRILVHRMHPYMSPAAMVSAGFAAHLTKDYAQTVGKICAGLYAAHQPNTQNPILNPYLGSALMESTFYLLFAAIQYQDAAQRGWTISKLNDIAEMTGWQTSASVAAACEVVWHKTGAAGKGPPYTITMDENNKDVRVRNMFGRNSTRGNVEKIPEAKVSEKQEQPAFLSHDRVLIDRNPASRVHWALGLLSVEEDIAKLNLGKQ